MHRRWQSLCTLRASCNLYMVRYHHARPWGVNLRLRVKIGFLCSRTVVSQGFSRACCHPPTVSNDLIESDLRALSGSFNGLMLDDFGHSRDMLGPIHHVHISKPSNTWISCTWLIDHIHTLGLLIAWFVCWWRTCDSWGKYGCGPCSPLPNEEGDEQGIISSPPLGWCPGQQSQSSFNGSR